VSISTIASVSERLSIFGSLFLHFVCSSSVDFEIFLIVCYYVWFISLNSFDSVLLYSVLFCSSLFCVNYKCSVNYKDTLK
jgi:hypothetical protein